MLTLLVADAKQPQSFLSALGRRQSWGPEHRAPTAAAAGAGGADWAWEEVFVCEEDENALQEILGSRGEGEAWRDALERGAVKLVRFAAGLSVMMGGCIFSLSSCSYYFASLLLRAGALEAVARVYGTKQLDVPAT